MLPDITGHQWGFAITQWILSIRCGFNAQIARRIFHQPGPSGAKLSGCSSAKLFLEILKVAPGTVDRGRHVPRRFAATVWLHRVPVKRVIPHLCRIVEQPTWRCRADQLFQGFIGFRFALREVIQVRDIGLVMPAIVKIERFGRDMGLQGIFGIREWW
jgi:hypothetical protein